MSEWNSLGTLLLNSGRLRHALDVFALHQGDKMVALDSKMESTMLTLQILTVIPAYEPLGKFLVRIFVLVELIEDRLVAWGNQHQMVPKEAIDDRYVCLISLNAQLIMLVIFLRNRAHLVCVETSLFSFELAFQWSCEVLSTETPHPQISLVGSDQVMNQVELVGKGIAPEVAKQPVFVLKKADSIDHAFLAPP